MVMTPAAIKFERRLSLASSKAPFGASSSRRRESTMMSSRLSRPSLIAVRSSSVSLGEATTSMRPLFSRRPLIPSVMLIKADEEKKPTAR